MTTRGDQDHVARPAGPLVELVAGLEHLEDDEVLDALLGLQRARARLAWAEHQALLRLAGPYQRTEEILVFDRRIDAERVVQVTDDIRDEVAAALHRSPSLVHDQITTARLLNGPLSDTSRALKEGRIMPAQVRVIVEQVRRLSGAVRWANVDPVDDSPTQAAERAGFERVCSELQHRVLPAAATQVPSQTRALARRVLASIDAAGERRRREQARCARDVWVSPDEDGIATLVARLDALTAHAIRAAIDAAAQDPAVAGDCAATAGERRAEALAALVLGQAQVSAHLEVTVPLASLCSGEGSAALPDGALVEWETARAVLDELADATHLRRLVTDPTTGTAIDLGRSRYEVSAPLRRWITARDRTCRFPGCRRRASRCQVDHIDPWDDGGPTDAANLQALCTRHHQLKTHRGWRATRDPSTGGTTWTSPLDRQYLVDPEPVPVTAPGSSPTDPDPPPF